MAKIDLLPGPLRRERWSPQAKVCGALYELSKVLREKTFFKEISTLTDFDTLATPELVRFTLKHPEVKDAFFQLLQDFDLFYPKSIGASNLTNLLRDILEFGLILGNSICYRKYCQASDLLGTSCSASRRIALEFFEQKYKKPEEPDIKEIMRHLIKITNGIRSAYVDN